VALAAAEVLLELGRCARMRVRKCSANATSLSRIEQRSTRAAARISRRDRAC
jgi:hypothetical protein